MMPDLVAADVAQTTPEARAYTAVGAVGIAAGLVLARGGEAAEDVAGTATADVGDGGGLLADLGALELLVEAQGLALSGGVDVASTASARVEARSGGGGRDGRSPGGNTGGRGGLGDTEEVASAATARVDVAVLGHGGVRLVDGVGRHFGLMGVVCGLERCCSWWEDVD